MPWRRQSGWRAKASTWASGPATRATDRADQVAVGRQGHHRRLVLVQGLDHVAPAVGGTGGRPGHVDEPDHLFERSDRVPVAQGEYSPRYGHRIGLPLGSAHRYGPDGR